MSAWVPNEESCGQLVQILLGTLDSDTRTRQTATDALYKATEEPDFDNYLLHILIAGLQLQPQVRVSAGLMLKNDLVKNWQAKTPELQAHILQDVPKGLLDGQSLVRNVTGNVITTLFSLIGIAQWPNILPNLMELATSTAAASESQEGAMSTLAKICEDSARTLDREYNGQRPLNFMVPQLIQLTSSPNEKVRELALSCLNPILLIKSQSILIVLDDFLQKLFDLASDENPKVRKSVCTAFACILDTSPDKLCMHLEGVINYSLHSMNDQEEEVALQACEVMLSLAAAEVPPELLAPKLPEIIPVLLKNMPYGEMEVFIMENQDEKDNETVADRDEDIKPQNAHSKETHKVSRWNEDGKESDTDSEAEEEELDLNPSWTLRKCSAASLDVLASKFAAEVFTISLPVIKERIVSDKWPVREAAILALGAIAEGCWEEASPELPGLIPFLVERLQDPRPRVRQMSAWTLGRYAVWVCNEAQAGGSCSSYFDPTFIAIMDCALDVKKVVQQSACSALTDYIENADADLVAKHAETLLQHFQQYFHKYQRKNLIILYDTVQTFAEKIGEQIRYNETYIKLLLPPLIDKWQKLDDGDRDLWPLLECMSSVAAALGENFAPYAMPVYERALRILGRCIDEDRMAHADPSFDAPEKDFIVTSIDLLDGLVQGLAHHFAELAGSQAASNSDDHSFIRLLLTCFDDTNDDVRQSAYALLGDLSIYLLDALVLPNLHEVMVNIGLEITNNNYNSIPACNNAVWALGEIVMRTSSETFEPYLENFIKMLVPLLLDVNNDTTLIENCAITIGRMGINNAASMSAYVLELLPSWCNNMKYLEENEEKETAFQGMCNMITSNPQAIEPKTADKTEALNAFIDSIGSYRNPGARLAPQFHMLLQGFKNGLGEEQWHNVLAQQDPECVQWIQSKYNV